MNITSTVKKYPRNLPFKEIKKAILGQAYDLSLVFVGERRAQALNQEHRHKSYIPNVLSFPLSSTTGEVFICPAVAEREAHEFELSTSGYITYLFIHGLLHLKGHDHGRKMDTLEKKYMKQFKVK